MNFFEYLRFSRFGHLSGCMDGKEIVPVVIRVNKKKAEHGGIAYEVAALKSINAKKTEQGRAISDSRVTAADAPIPRISVSNLLKRCQSKFKEISMGTFPEWLTATAERP